MSKANQACKFCFKKFKRVKGHYAFCKAQPPPNAEPSEAPAAQSSVDTASKNYFAGVDNARKDQRYRSENAIISLTESIARLNNALATVVGEGRLS